MKLLTGQNTKETTTLLAQLKSPKAFAHALFQLMQNSIISLRVYTSMLLVDNLLHYYLVIMLLLRQLAQQHQNSGNGATLNKNRLSQVSNSLNVIQMYISAEKAVQLGMQIAILIMQIGIIVGIIIIIMKVKGKSRGTAGLERDKSIFKKVMSMVITCYLTVLTIPMFEIIVATFFIPSNSTAAISGASKETSDDHIVNTSDKTILLVLYALASVNLSIILILHYLLRQLYTLRTPPQDGLMKVYWASPNSSSQATLKMLTSLALVILHLYGTRNQGANSNIIYLEIIMAIVFGIQAISKVLYYGRHYLPTIEWLMRLNDIVTCLLLVLVSLTGYIATQHSVNSAFDYQSYILIGIGSFPALIILMKQLDKRRETQLIEDVLAGQLKSEKDWELLLCLLVKNVSELFTNQETQGAGAMHDELNSSPELSQLLYLVERHSTQCEKYLCDTCQSKDLLLQVLNKAYQTRTNDVTFNGEEAKLIERAFGPKLKLFRQMKQQQLGNRDLTQLQLNPENATNIMQNQLSLKSVNDIGSTQAPLGSTIGGTLLNNPDTIIKPLKLTGTFIKPLNLTKPTQPLLDHTLKINAQVFKETFFCQFLIDTFFKQAFYRFPSSSKNIHYLFGYVAIYLCKNRYMAENLLKIIATHGKMRKTSWVDKICLKVYELYLVTQCNTVIGKGGQAHNKNENYNLATASRADMANWGIRINSKTNNQHSGSSSSNQFNILNNFDPDVFISNTKLTDSFYEIVEEIVHSVQNFWRLIKHENLQVVETQEESVFYAERIGRVIELYNAIEMSSANASGSASSGASKGVQDFKVCQTFAFFYKLILNDNQSFSLYISKINTQREMLRLLRNNMLQGGSMDSQVGAAGGEHTGFIVVSGTNDCDFGKIVLSNQQFRQKMGYTQKDLQTTSIEDFMPSLLGQWHQRITRSQQVYSQTIQGLMHDKTIFTFLKLKNGYAIPIMLNVRQHHSHAHDLTYVCFISFLTEMKLFKGNSKHKVDDIMFFLCEPSDSTIWDVSEPCQKQLGLYQHYINQSSELQTEKSRVTIQEVFPQLLEQNRGTMNKGAPLSSRKISGQVPEIENDNEMIDIDLGIVSKLKRGQATSRMLESYYSKAIYMKYEEKFGRDQQRGMVVYAVILMDQAAVQNYQKQKYQRNHLLHSGANLSTSSNNGGRHSIPITQGGEVMFNRNLAAISEDDEETKNAIEEYYASQSQTSSVSSNDHTSTQISQLRQMYTSTSSADMKTSGSLKLIMQLTFMVFLLLLALSTLNLVLSLNRYEALQKDVTIVRKAFDRIQSGSKIRFYFRAMLISANGYSSPDYKASLKRFNEFQNELRQELVTMKDIVEFFNRQRTDEEYPELQAYMGDKNCILEYLNPDNESYSENQTYAYAMNLYLQKASYFANKPMEAFNVNITIMQIEPPPKGYKPNIYERDLYFLVMTAKANMRSVGYKIADLRQAKAISNALNVAQATQITIIVSVVAIILVASITTPIFCKIEERKYQALTFFLQVDKQALQTLDEQIVLFVRMYGQDNQQKKSNKERQIAIQEQELGSIYSSSGSSSYMQSQISGNGSYKPQLKQINENPQYSSSIEKQNGLQFVSFSQQQHQNVLSSASNNEVLNNSTQSQNKPQSLQQLADARLDNSEKDENVEINSQILYEEKLMKIRLVTKQKKLRILLLIISIASIISTYFIVGYFFSVLPFQSTPEILDYLTQIYIKDYNLENAMVSNRDGVIFNQTLQATEDPDKIGATTYFLQKLQESERKYLLMRKNPPSAFASLTPYFNRLETTEVCDIIFSERHERLTYCKTFQDGIMLTGLTNTITTLARIFTSRDSEFRQKYPRDLKYLLGEIKNQLSIKSVDLKHLTLDVVVAQMKVKVTEAVNKYYQDLITNYRSIFIGFVILMTFLFIVMFCIGYNRLRFQMWKSNMSLKILPMEFLPQSSLPSLKAFFNS